VLTLDGYRMMLAFDGEEGLRLFEEHAEIIDLVLLDIVMPGMDGKEAYQRIKAIKPGVAVLFHSGYNLDSEYTEFIAANGLRLLRKPYASEELRNAVADVLKKSRGE
jgi:CheY-like chemotaxis protein